MYRYSLSDNKMYAVNVSGVTHPGFFMPLQGACDKYAATTDNRVVIVQWDGRLNNGKIVQEVLSVTSNTWINSALALPKNRLYLGNYGHNYCNEAPTHFVYEYTSDSGLTQEATHLASTVGMVLVKNVFYQLDACAQILWGFDVCSTTGNLSTLNLLRCISTFFALIN